MAGYIDYARLRDEIFYDPNYDCDTINHFLNIIDAQPIADVEKVKHGEWVYHECVASHDGTISIYACSECKGAVDEETFCSDEFHKAFCGCCGAKMDGKKG